MNKSRKFIAFITFTFFLCFFFIHIFAQNIDEDDKGWVISHHVFYAGVVAGINLCQVNGDNFAGYHKVGSNFGFIGYVRVRKHLALSYELLYSQRGSKSNAGGQYFVDSFLVSKYWINLNYAEIPIMINVFDKYKSHIGAGISYSRLLNSSELATTDPPTNMDLSKYAFIKNNMEFVVSAELHVWKGLFFNLRYQYSIIPMRLSVPPNLSRGAQYNNLWSIRMMYLVF